KAIPTLCLAAALWTTVWSTTAYLFGQVIVQGLNSKGAWVALLGLALIVFLRRRRAEAAGDGGDREPNRRCGVAIQGKSQLPNCPPL
ncbi:MAG TPA: hypothetical protein VJB15_12920, partial [Rhodothermia bacterium]|nr:hypothetical protein [Rhodothermia bacterium]